MYKPTDEEKIEFFDQNWQYISRIIEVINGQTEIYIPAGTHVLAWLANWMERNFGK